MIFQWQIFEHEQAYTQKQSRTHAHTHTVSSKICNNFKWKFLCINLDLEVTCSFIEKITHRNATLSPTKTTFHSVIQSSLNPFLRRVFDTYLHIYLHICIWENGVAGSSHPALTNTYPGGSVLEIISTITPYFLCWMTVRTRSHK